jgi:hypothetical protein
VLLLLLLLLGVVLDVENRPLQDQAGEGGQAAQGLRQSQHSSLLRLEVVQLPTSSVMWQQAQVDVLQVRQRLQQGRHSAVDCLQVWAPNNLQYQPLQAQWHACCIAAAGCCC